VKKTQDIYTQMEKENTRFYYQMKDYRKSFKNDEIPFSSVMSFPDHHEVYCSTYDLFDFGFFDKRTISWHGNSIMVRFENRAYYCQLHSGWDGVHYPPRIISSVEIPNESFWNRLLDTISEDRQKRIKKEARDKDLASVKLFYVNIIRPVRLEFINLGEQLTKYYFTSLAKEMKCKIDWIDYKKLFETSWWNLVEEMKKYYEMEYPGYEHNDNGGNYCKICEKDGHTSNTYWCEEFKNDLCYTNFSDKYPFFQVIMSKCEKCNDIDDVMRKLNYEVNYAVFCFVWEKLLKNPRLPYFDVPSIQEEEEDQHKIEEVIEIFI
jgi:hypothetical protein